MTVHGGLTYTQWQRAKLGPNFARDLRNMQHEMAYRLVPVIQAWADAVLHTAAIFQDALDEVLTVMGSAPPPWPPPEWERQDQLQTAMRAAWSIAPVPRLPIMPPYGLS